LLKKGSSENAREHAKQGPATRAWKAFFGLSLGVRVVRSEIADIPRVRAASEAKGGFLFGLQLVRFFASEGGTPDQTATGVEGTG